jgi:hypothetical protein
MAAARAMLDEEPGLIRRKKIHRIMNTYFAGRVHDHNVVILCVARGD